MNKILKWTLALCGLLLILAAGAVWLWGYILWDMRFSGEPFDRAKWLEIGDFEEWYRNVSTDPSPCPRGPMVEDLTENHLPLGQGKDEIIAFLGEPKEKAVKFDKYDNCIYFFLGFCSGYRFDVDSLHLCFDKDDRLIDAFPVQH